MFERLPETVNECLAFAEREEPLHHDKVAGDPAGYTRIVAWTDDGMSPNPMVISKADDTIHNPWLVGVDAHAAAELLISKIRELLEILATDLDFWRLVNEGPSEFRYGDIRNLPSFANKIRQPSHAGGISQYVSNQLSTAQKLLANYAGGPNVALEEALIKDLNQLIQSSLIYEARRFKGVDLSAETRSALESYGKPHGLLGQKERRAALVRLNLRLLKEAFPLELDQEVPPHLIKYHIRSRFGLWLPEFSANIWMQLGRDAGARQRLFEILSGQHWRLVAGDKGILRPDLNKLIQLINQYFRHSQIDLKCLLAAQTFTSQQLAMILRMASHLKADAEWVIKNPGKTIRSTLREQPGRPADIHVARRREQMLQLFKENPSETQWNIAESCGDNTVGSRTRRKEACRAALLLQLREGISVKRHVSPSGFGQKPLRGHK